MKRKQLIAILGSVSLMLTSCSSGGLAYAEQTEEEMTVTAEAAELAILEETAETVPEEAPAAEPVLEATVLEPAPANMETGSAAGQDTGDAGTEPVEAAALETEAAPASETDTPVTEPDPDPGTDAPAAEPGAEPGTEAPAAEPVTEPGTEVPAAEPVTEPGRDNPETETAADPEIEETGEGMTELAEDAETGTETEGVSEVETENVVEEETEPKEETEEETEEPDYEEPGYSDGVYSGSYNGYYWDDSWYVSPDFRFTQVDKVYALIGCAGGSFVYEKEAESSREVGEIPYGGVVCILKDSGNGWIYVECGGIRGFVKETDLTVGGAAENIVNLVGEAALTQGDLLIEKADNAAFTYTRTTSYPVLADKIYAMSLGSSWVYEYPNKSSRFIGDVASGNLMYVLRDCGNGWYFIESGDVRGFIPSAGLLLGNGADGIVEDLGEENAPLAEQLVDPEENRSVYYTLLSVQEPGNAVGTAICETAKSLIGHLPYVYGGTSLSAGADCSGFVQSIFAGYGISLPRTAQEQGANGQAVLSLEEAQPGDIVYYASGPHVGIYVGNGFVVQCSGNEGNTPSNPGKGPTLSRADYMPVTTIRRYLVEREKTSSEGGYRTDATPYTRKQLEIIWAIVAQEDNGSYEGALAVISSAMNRTESAAWGYEGSNAFAQLTAAGQYCYSLDHYWEARLNGNVPAYVKQAVEDCLHHGIRNHTHTSFRSSRGKTTGGNAVQIGGNWYFGT